MSYQPATQRTTNQLAVVSLVFGIATWLLLPVVGAIVAVVCGHMARKEIRRAPQGAVDGDGLALAGLILGYTQIVFTVLGALFVIAFIAFGLGVGASYLH
ncbi:MULTISPECIES: DUF4190 domain-containing protein [Dyella]|uniref:DUF4190 domain-containing protein n=1 Tax=Dyella TaxID=231454 RepID=UPI000C84CDE4|nr:MULTISPECIES: DUF4190 domain-containing protein [Dyella]MDR3445938.1 DUF4190 domain-containing protein [Dyella sp.]PMQ02879.1 hypothetical protein DyAD56_22370 [Dyella sp. AD56]ULU27832.1 DUF4190 protein [Dyella terrae]